MKMGQVFEGASQLGKVYAIVGGLHGFNDFDLSRDWELICPTYCTEEKAEKRSLFRERYIDGGAGQIIML